MLVGYIRLISVALFQALVARVIYYIEKTAWGRKLPYAVRQVSIGIIFGILAICGTEFGIPMNGAQMNVRDAAVMIPGFLFGAPAGIIAGLIGGIERWIAVAWGVGSYTRLACSLSTCLAGFFVALLRIFLFEKKKPPVEMAATFAVTIEIFHLLMVFVTNMDDANHAIVFVRSCTLPMVLANALSVLLATLLVTAASAEGSFRIFKKRDETPVFETIQRAMTCAIIFCLILSCLFVYRLEDNLSIQQTKDLLQNSLKEAGEELEDQIDDYMLDICELLKKDWESGDQDLNELADWYNVQEIYIVDEHGIITDSNDEKNIGYDMSSGEQSAEFLCLLTGQKEYVQSYQASSSDANEMRKYAGIALDQGFLQISYDAKALSRQVDKEIEGLVRNRHCGASGYVVILDPDSNLVAYSRDYNPKDYNERKKAEPVYEGELGTTRMSSGTYYYMYQQAESYYVCAFYPQTDTQTDRDISIYLTMYLLILVFAVLYIVLYMMIKRIVVNQIVKMADSLSVISEGNLDEVVDVNSNEEFASLSQDINRTVDTLKRYIAEAAARIDAELEMAQKIQTAALPHAESAFNKRKDFDIYASMDPAKEVGGDFYDFYFTAGNELNVMIADVSGKGIPAAMFMMRAKSVLRDLTDMGHPIQKVFMEANNALCQGNDAEMFVTAWQCRLDTANGHVDYANAGHNPPLVRHGDGSFEYVKQKKGLVLGAMEDMPYRPNELQLDPGDILFLYTDGVVEATDAHMNLYGEERLKQILNTCQYDSMKDLLQKVRADVDAFVGEADQFDDLTMVAVRYLGTEAGE